MRKTKILATLGPASKDVDTIKKLINAGMDAARINFSHGTYDTLGELVDNLKKARTELNEPIPLLLDTKGPEIRIKTFNVDRIFIEQGANFTLTTEDLVGDQTKVSVTYSNLPKDLQIGSKVLIDDGLIELKVQHLTDTDIECIAINSGFLSSRKGINVPDVYINLPSLTENDINDIKFGVANGFDFVAASFIRSANDVITIREILEKNGGEDIKIIAKIETRDGVDNIDSILEVSDGIMVARGDLGVEIATEEVPLIQKMLIRKANVLGKTVITATQMLESMVKNPRPTRAEANDVANAIFDGSDVIMLSGETANGEYPIDSIKTMARIARKIEESIDYYKEISLHHRGFKANITNAISYATCTTAADLDAACIVSITDSGFTARMVSKFRPVCPILAVTGYERAWRQLNLAWGCYPTLCENIKGNDEVFDIAETLALNTGLAKNGDTIVTVAGVPIGIAGTTNTLKVRFVGDVIVKGRGIGSKTISGIARVIKVDEKGDRYFEKGDILVATQTTDDMIHYLRRSSAVIVGSWENIDNFHTETVAKALDIPVIICKNKVVDLIKDGIVITVDAKDGFVYNGLKESVKKLPEDEN